MIPAALAEPATLDRPGPWRPAWARGVTMVRSFSTADTVAVMERLAKGDQWKPRVRALAVRAWQKVKGREASPLQVALAVEAEVKAAVEYTPDPANVELVVAPEELLSLPIPAEDCESMDALAASALLALGLSPRFARLDFRGDGAADPYEHVVVQVPVGEGLPEAVLDPTYPGSVAEMLSRVRRAYVHGPIGRSEVHPPGW